LFEVLLDDYVPADHLLRSIDRFVDCSVDSLTGGALYRSGTEDCMLLIGYCFRNHFGAAARDGLGDARQVGIL